MSITPRYLAYLCLAVCSTLACSHPTRQPTLASGTGSPARSAYPIAVDINSPKRFRIWRSGFEHSTMGGTKSELGAIATSQGFTSKGWGRNGLGCNSSSVALLAGGCAPSSDFAWAPFESLSGQYCCHLTFLWLLTWTSPQPLTYANA